MKKTQLKDTIRNIRKEFVSFLSILVIALLAVAAYLGINFASAAIKDRADVFYDELHFRDIEIASTMLLSEEDIRAFENTEGVKQVEGIYFLPGRTQTGEKRVNVGVVSLTEKLNTVSLVEGRLPENNKECVLEDELLQTLGMSVGDTIKVTDPSGSDLSYLSDSKFKITGSVLHPAHFALKGYEPDDRYVLVNKDAFDAEKLDGCFMKAEIAVEGAEPLSRYSEPYEKLISAVKGRLEPLNKQLAKQREETVREKMQEQIQEGEEKLSEGKEKLSEGKQKLDDGRQELENGRKKLEELKAMLEEGEGLIQSGEAELANAAALLAEGKAKLDEAKQQLDWGQEKLDSTWAELEAGKAKLDAGWTELEAGKAKLEDANAQLTSAYNEAEGKKTEVRDLIRAVITELIGEKAAASIPWAEHAPVSDVNDPNLNIGIFKITDGLSVDLTISLKDRLENAVREILRWIGREDLYQRVISRIENSEIFILFNDEYDALLEKMNQWNSGHTQYLDGQSLYQGKLSEYEQGLALYNSALEQYNAGAAEFYARKEQYEQGLALYNSELARYNEGRALLDEKTREYYRGIEEYNNGIGKLREAEEKLAEGETEYSKAEKEYKKGQGDLKSAKQKMEELPPCAFVLLTCKDNGGFLHAKEASGNVGKIGITFALLFVLVGALVIYVTLGRMIGEQRTLVGAQKALGFFNREVLAKYMIYGTSATLAGMLLGTLAGYFVIQAIITGTYARFYVIDSMPGAFRPALFGIVIAVGLVLSALAVWWASRALLKQTARELMQPELPKGKKKSAGGSGRKGSSLYSSLIFRNIITDWKRVLITTISIAGCCTLLVVGFQMRIGISKTIDAQFETIMKYEQEISFSSGESETAEQDIKDALAKKNISSAGLYSGFNGYNAKGEIVLTKLYAGDPEILAKGFDLQSVSKDEKLEFSDHGLIIPKKLAETSGLKCGDKMTLYDKDMSPHEAEISGIYNNYLGRFFFMSKEAYENVFAKEMEDNTIWAMADLDEKEIDDLLRPIKGYSGVELKSKVQEMYGSLARVISLVTLVLIVAAAMMAYFVLLNLVNMYLNRKKRELVVMRINGFTTKEVLRYVSMESIVTTLAGIILGLALGTALGNLILILLEQGSVCFSKGIFLLAWLFATILTIVFSAVINAIALRKVKTLKLNDM